MLDEFPRLSAIGKIRPLGIQKKLELVFVTKVKYDEFFRRGVR